MALEERCMYENDTLIKNIQRCLKKNVAIDKYIKQLRAQKKQDVLLRVGLKEITLLMYYCINDQLLEVKKLLSGENSANVLVQNKEGFNALSLAVLVVIKNKRDDLSIINELLKINPVEQLTVVTKKGSLLSLAIQNNRNDIAQQLLDKAHTQLFFIDHQKGLASPLYLAVKNSNETIVKILLQVEAEKQLLQKQSDGNLPFHMALKLNNPTLINLLLSHVTDQQLTSQPKNITPFGLVASAGCYEFVDELTDKYPQLLETFSQSHSTPLQDAASQGDLLMVKLLLKKAAIEQVITCDEKNMLPLGYACNQDFSSIVEELLCYYPREQIEAIYGKSQTIFHICCALNAEASLRTIIKVAKQYAIDLKPLILREDKNPPPLFILISQTRSAKNIAMIKLLLEIDTDTQLLREYHKNQYTPLLWAIKEGREDIVELFLNVEDSTQLDEKVLNKMLPFEHPFCKERLAIIEKLITYLNEQQLIILSRSLVLFLYMAICFNQKQAFETIVNLKILPLFINSSEQNYGTTPIQIAIAESCYWAFKILIEKGADINAKDNRGRTPLHTACQFNRLAYIHDLIAAGVNINAYSNEGRAPLHIAVARGNLEAVKILIAHSAQLHVKDNFNNTPLFTAILYDHFKIAQYLLEQGANPNVCVELEGKYINPLLLAIQQLDLEFVQLLAKHGASTEQAIFKDQSITFAEYINLQFAQSPGLYNAIRQILPQLAALKKTTVVSNNALNLTDDKICINPRRYLQDMGYSLDIIEQFEQTRKENKKILKQNRSASAFFVQDTRKLVEISSWLEGSITSENESIILITSPDNSQSYAYIDKKTLIEQGCDPSKFDKRRFKFDNTHLKKLDNSKGIYYENVILSKNNKPEKIIYTHEWKITQMDRVLFFSINADKGKASLFIGLRYVPEGLHSTIKKNALKTSTQANAPLIVHWPTDAKSAEKNYATHSNIDLI
jgi:ankyrin repeat protein